MDSTRNRPQPVWESSRCTDCTMTLPRWTVGSAAHTPRGAPSSGAQSEVAVGTPGLCGRILLGERGRSPERLEERELNLGLDPRQEPSKSLPTHEAGPPGRVGGTWLSGCGSPGCAR